MIAGYLRCKSTARLAVVAIACCHIAAATDFLPQVKLLVKGKPCGVATGDFNGDGKADIAVAQLYGKIINILLSNGDGTFQHAVNYSVGAMPVSVAVADLNRDGKLDLVVAEETGTLPGQSLNTVGVLLGNGDGTFQPDISYPAGSHPVVVIADDFNGDGKPDVAVANYGGGNGPASLVVLLGMGDGSLQTPGIAETRLVNTPAGLAVGDFNGDGKLDIAMSCRVGRAPVSVRLGNGDGTFQAPIILDRTSFALAVAVGDLNGDGNLDVVASNYGGYYLSVFLGNGDGTFQANKKYSAKVDVFSVAIGDYDGDGKPDLAVIDGFAKTKAGVLPGNGDGSFARAQTYAVGHLPVAVAVGDFTGGHGFPDLAVANKSDGTISVLINKSH